MRGPAADVVVYRSVWRQDKPAGGPRCVDMPHSTPGLPCAVIRCLSSSTTPSSPERVLLAELVHRVVLHGGLRVEEEHGPGDQPVLLDCRPPVAWGRRQVGWGGQVEGLDAACRASGTMQ